MTFLFLSKHFISHLVIKNNGDPIYPIPSFPQWEHFTKPLFNMAAGTTLTVRIQNMSITRGSPRLSFYSYTYFPPAANPALAPGNHQFVLLFLLFFKFLKIISWILRKLNHTVCNFCEWLFSPRVILWDWSRLLLVSVFIVVFHGMDVAHLQMDIWGVSHSWLLQIKLAWKREHKLFVWISSFLWINS